MGSAGADYLSTSQGTLILTGGILGTLMFANVWLIIWPNNKLIIENAHRTSKGESPIPGVADLASRAAIASRTNTLFSLPMLFFMAAPSHLGAALSPDKSLVPYWSVFGILVGMIEFNAIKGKMGPMQKLMVTIKGGMILAVVLYLALAFLAG